MRAAGRKLAAAKREQHQHGASCTVAGAACDVSGVRSGHGFPFISCSCAITGGRKMKKPPVQRSGVQRVHVQLKQDSPTTGTAVGDAQQSDL